MRRLMLGAGCAAMLTGCAQPTPSTPSLPKLPDPPPAALEPCLPRPQRRQADGSATVVDDDATIRDGRFDLAACEAKRRLLAEAWPR
ncbi:hypothetical protein LK533_15035 [Sphingomonas sp. PL-96]|uniref:hypothetical protein n=1 Tax=Sphingomonas sp. PL-96 TaxID=2887201 RepID=UPI001E3387E8|nr:hypothetical protein [Sphingomonas sp. PL-96]MCC2977978.1 hypothetical protein [Sphingomonas sp. PL-96]